jgi:predicted flavoprotein YhiN
MRTQVALIVGAPASGLLPGAQAHKHGMHHFIVEQRNGE